MCGEIESTKSVSELFAPVDGTVVEVNTAAVDDPSVVNADPYGAGWLLKVAVAAGPAVCSAPSSTRRSSATERVRDPGPAPDGVI